MYAIEDSPSRYYQIMRHYQEGQLLFAAIRLDLFSFLDTPQRAEEIAEATGCDKIQMDFMLLSLVSCGFVHKQGDFYINASETKSFLSRNSKVFLGDTLLFREKMTSLSLLEEKVKAPPAGNGPSYDFSELARLTIPEMYTGRVQVFMDKIGKLYPNNSDTLHILDLGGGAGILDIEFIKQFPNSKATILETPEVSKVTREIVQQHHMQQKIDVISGDFNSDPLDGPYDFIIASGILNFVEGDLSVFMEKLSDALKDGGYLFIIGQFAEDKNSVPANMISWLSGFLEGIPLPPSAKEIETVLQKSGFNLAERIKVSLFEGHLYQKDRRNLSVPSSEVIDSFIMLTERIANSKTNVLDFGSEEMTFYRGEIHMIKTIGDYPGIHSAELARKYGITRPVVHKTLQKLSERGLIVKQDDPEDKKRYLLYLTEKGQTAYHAHKKYHDEYDKALFDFLGDTSGDKLAAMKGFLDHAISLIEHHS
ncbi:methyltransferase domain-containing protein [Aminipila butyrica]|uniref:Methyltransferase domain-containing protein n=1 Tax=Aminipila butyrica TaxID=433296 RepID=A0A858BXR6_9FIRM|nr:methyltransferase [Aminipila butyrica]QIB69700.1 methyltransferase domain-containing protein [Aminipila butyrica]